MIPQPVFLVDRLNGPLLPPTKLKSQPQRYAAYDAKDGLVKIFAAVPGPPSSPLASLQPFRSYLGLPSALLLPRATPSLLVPVAIPSAATDEGGVRVSLLIVGHQSSSSPILWDYERGSQHPLPLKIPGTLVAAAICTLLISPSPNHQTRQHAIFVTREGLLYLWAMVGREFDPASPDPTTTDGNSCLSLRLPLKNVQFAQPIRLSPDAVLLAVHGLDKIAIVEIRREEIPTVLHVLPQSREAKLVVFGYLESENALIKIAHYPSVCQLKFSSHSLLRSSLGPEQTLGSIDLIAGSVCNVFYNEYGATMGVMAVAEEGQICGYAFDGTLVFQAHPPPLPAPPRPIHNVILDQAHELKMLGDLGLASCWSTTIDTAALPTPSLIVSNDTVRLPYPSSFCWEFDSLIPVIIVDSGFLAGL